MSESAPPAQRRVAETSRALTTEARRLTAERGLHGFTVEELCSEVGVSRRTLFNHFASKEHAVIGITARVDFAELDQPFVDAGPSDTPRRLVDDFAELLISRWELLALSAADAMEIAAVFAREPRLLGHVVDHAAQSERHDIALIERRESLTPGDSRAATVVQVLGALLRPSALEFFSSHDEDFRAIYLRRLELLREVFAD